VAPRAKKKVVSGADVAVGDTYTPALESIATRHAALLAEAAELEPIMAGLRKLVNRSGHAVPAAPVTQVTAPPVKREPKAPHSAAVSRTETEPSGDYRGMELIDAAHKYLGSVGVPKSTREIANALVAGGLSTKANNFPGTVSAMLRRPKAVTLGIKKDEKLGWYLGQR
jgi:hypothetical protein